jgi:riboflavin kinase/FMN adenylyltransferase
VRELLAEGEIRRAAALLGRHHRFDGTVVEGQHRGQALGFPTANLRLDDDTLRPCGGVYAVRVHLPGAVSGGMLNIGNRPTFGEIALSVEVHVFDFHGDLYGQTLGVEMIERLRDEQRFASPLELAAQLQRDRDAAQEILAREVSDR